MRHSVKQRVACVALFCMVMVAAGSKGVAAAESSDVADGKPARGFRLRVEVASPVPRGRVPIDPMLDLDAAIKAQGGEGVLDPNSIRVIDLATGNPVAFARSEDFAYGDRGRLEWVVTDPEQTSFEVQFQAAAARPSLVPQDHTPLIGVGDLLRYNADGPRPIALPYASRLVDLTGDGLSDLVGCWNYAYRPGGPWCGIVCYPRVGSPQEFLFGDLVRIRHREHPTAAEARHFRGSVAYMWSDFADFDADGHLDIVWALENVDRLQFFRNTGSRDDGGMPVFVPAGSVPKSPDDWQSCRATDLDGDGLIDVVLGDVWFRNTKPGSMPPALAAPEPLGILAAGYHRACCWHDVDQDGRTDAVSLEPVPGQGLNNFRTVWRRQAAGSPPRFEAARPLVDLPNAADADAAGKVERPYYLTSVRDGGRSGLLVTMLPNLTAVFYEQQGPERFGRRATAESRSAVISLSDQAWPHLCDWDGDGDLDLLVGGGLGWPQIVINEGTAQRPRWAAVQPVLSEGRPIRLTRNEILGGENHHDMGYPYPAFVDWDGDGLPDLMMPNETNRIFWYRNVGTREQPRFGPRQQVLCGDADDSPEAGLASNVLAKEDPAHEHASGKRYPLEPGQPFFWRTGAAFADFDGDGVIDMVTHDGGHRMATLFVQDRRPGKSPRLRRVGPLETADGKPIDGCGRPGHLTDSFRAVDWDGDGLIDLVHSSAGTWTGGDGVYRHPGMPGGSSVRLLRNVGTPTKPIFAPPRPMLVYGEPIAMTHHGPHPWAGDLDGDGLPDLVTCVEWSVYPFYSHNAIELAARPTVRIDPPAEAARRLDADADTVALWRFDEGQGNEAHDACGDPSLTLRAKAAQWGERFGGVAAARFERRADDATVFIGPKNHDKLHLRTCPDAWTVEAWVRYTGPGGLEDGNTYVNICGNDDEGFGLEGVRGGWNFAMGNFDRLAARGQAADLKAGIAPCARFMGNLRGRDPNHDTGAILFPYGNQPGTAYVGVNRGGFIRDHGWHHVVWQFRHADQTHFFLLDGKLLCRHQLPSESDSQGEVINDSQSVGVPFTVGGFVHSQNPPYFLGHSNFEGEIADLRISRVLRYPVAERLSIVKRRGRAADGLALVAGEGLPFEVRFRADAAQGAVRWKIASGDVPAGLSLDPDTGTIAGTAAAACDLRKVTIEATDTTGASDRHTVAIEVRAGRIATASLPPAFAGQAYDAALAVEHLAAPVDWQITAGELPGGLRLDPAGGALRGTPAATSARTRSVFRIRATDSRGVAVDRELALPVLPAELATIAPDAHTVFLYDWQGEKARLIHDVTGDESLALDWTNMGGDRRVNWPGRDRRFPQETGHGEHGFASLAKNHDKHNLRTCPDGWTVEAWVRRGGPLLAFAAEFPNAIRTAHAKRTRFDYGHICGTYDTTKRGVWELYLSDADSPDGSMAVGVHFFGNGPEQALENLHPWKRPKGIVGDPAAAGIRDTEWHHVAWQYRTADDLHSLFLDGRPIWRMRSPDGRRLVNDRQHEAQFSVFTRINGYVIRGHGEDNAFSNHFNYRGFGNFFGQIGEIRVSNVSRYD